MVRRYVVLSCSLAIVWSTLAAAPSPVGADPVDPPGITDAQSAPDESTARQIASAFGHPVAIDADTSETSITNAQPDGSLQLTESTAPVRVQRNGAWVPVDNTLGAASGGMLQPSAAAVPVQFSAGGSTPLAKIQAASGQWLTETWQAGPLPTPQVAGSSVTYPDVYPGVDLELTATSTGMSEVLVVKSAEAAANPALASVGFGVDDGSLTTSTVPGGTAIARSPDGSAQLASTTATWWDSSSPGASAAGPGGLGLPIPVANTSSSNEITVDAASVASAPAVTYPVYVDPSWTGGRKAWAFVDSAYPDTAYWDDAGASDSYQHVGYVSAGQSDDGRAHTTRAYWQMDTSVLNSKYIKSASFNTTETYSFSCAAREVDLYYAHSVTPSSTWHNQPGLIAKLDSHNVVAHGYNSNCGPASVGFDATAGVQAAADGNADTVTLALLAKDEADEYGWKKFDSVASMIVTFENYPQVPAGRAVTPCWAQCDEPTITRLNNPGVQAVSFINETNPPNLLYRYQVCSSWSATSPGPCQPFFTDTKPFGVTSAVAVPEALAATGNYEYRAQTCRADDTVVCSHWSDFYQFSVDSQPPPAPAVASSDFDLTGAARTGQELVPGAIQISPNGSVDDYAYSYSPTAGSTSISSPSCPATYGDVLVKCAGAGGVPVSFAVLPTVPTSNRVVVYAYDKAGNVSAPAKYAYDVLAKKASEASHAWFDRNAPALGSSIPDAVSASSPVTLGPVDGTHVSWLSPTSTPGPPLSDSGYGALTFDGTRAVSTSPSATPVATLDSTHSFTVAAWLLPANPSQGQFAAVSQDSGNSAFFLQEQNSKWQFCLPRSLTNAWGSDCATSTSDVDPTDWTLLIGQWDAPNHTIRLYIGDQSTSSTSDHPYIADASTGPVVLGRMQYGGIQKNWWTGGIADPITYPFLLDAGQISALRYANVADCLSQGNCS